MSSDLYRHQANIHTYKINTSKNWDLIFFLLLSYIHFLHILNANLVLDLQFESQVWWYIPVILTLGLQTLEDQKFKVILHRLFETGKLGIPETLFQRKRQFHPVTCLVVFLVCPYFVHSTEIEPGASSKASKYSVYH